MSSALTPKTIKHLSFSIFLPLILVSAVYSSLWFYAAHELRSQLSDIKSNLAEDHWEMTYDELSIHGFPRKLNARLSKVLIKGLYNKTIYSVPESTIEFWPLPGRNVDMRIPQIQVKTVSLPDPALDISDTQLRYKLPILSFKNTYKSHIYGYIQTIKLHEEIEFPFDHELTDISFEGMYEDNTSERLDIISLSAFWHEMTTTVNGGMYLDEKGYLQGEFKTKFSNFIPALNVLKTQMNLTRNAQMGLSALMLLSKKENGVPTLKMPIQITDGIVQMGAFKLGRIQAPSSVE